MPPKRQNSNKSLPTDLPTSITDGASSTFDNYLQSRKRRRVDRNQHTSTYNSPADQDPVPTTQTDPVTTSNETTSIPNVDSDNRIQQDRAAEETAQHINPSQTIHHGHELSIFDEGLQDNIMIPSEHNDDPSGMTHPSVPVNTTEHTDNQSESLSQLVKRMNKGLHYAASWSNVFTYLLVNGRTRFSREQYGIVQETVKSMSHSQEKLLSYSSARQNQSEYFRSVCFPKSTTIWLPCEDLPKTLARDVNKTETTDGEMADDRECVRIVMPSSWAKYDMSNFPTYCDLKEGNHVHDTSQLSIERSPLVQDREHNLGSSTSFWSMHEGNLVSLSIGTLVSIPVSDRISATPRLGPWTTDYIENQHTLVCKTGPQWCVSAPKYSSIYRPSFDTSSLSAEEHKVYVYLKESHLTFEEFNNIEEQETKAKRKGKSNNTQVRRIICDSKSPSIFPGDVCVFLRHPGASSSQDDGRVVCLMVSSFVSSITGLPSKRIIWVSIKDGVLKSHTSSNTVIEKLCLRLELRSVTKVTAVPSVHDANTVPIVTCENGHSMQSGTLSNGRKFVNYRFAFYADEFGFNGVCGCYILLLGTSQQNRQSAAGVRVLTLVPKLQNVNKVIMAILDDIFEGMVHGFPCINPFGEEIVVYTDMCAVFADYLKMSSITNTAGHSATCFCTYCRVPRSVSNIGPVYTYSTLTHCRNEAFMRTDEKIDILLSLPLSKKSKQKLGLKTTSPDEAKNIPLVYFSQYLKGQENFSDLTTTDRPVPIVFDSTLSTAVAPDHLLSGLIATVLEACFRALPCNFSRRLIEKFILQSAVDNSLPTQGSLLRFNGNTFDGLNSMTMSTLYVLLLFASYYFRNLSGSHFDTQGLFLIPAVLQEFISKLYYWPDIELDDVDDVAFIQDRYPNPLYFVRLRKLAFQYTDMVGEHMRKYGAQAHLRDRPNSHRLIELAVHTVPLFGHGKLTSELVLELTHAFFKGYFKQNTHSSSHLTAIDLFSTRIWCSNVFILYHFAKNGTEFEREMAISNLFRLFFGNEAWELYSADDNSSHVGELMDQFKANIDNMMRQPVTRMFQGSIPIGYIVDKVLWLPKEKVKGQFDTTTRQALQIFATNKDIIYEVLVTAVAVYERASLTIKGGFDMGIRTYPYKTVYEGTPIAFHVKPEEKGQEVVQSLADGHGVCDLLVVHRIITHAGISYVIGFALEEHSEEVGEEDNSHQSYKINKNRIRIIPLEKGISRVAYIPSFPVVAKKGEDLRSQETCPNHLLKGSPCHLAFRRHGYPPCLG